MGKLVESKMNWDNLLKPKRFREKSGKSNFDKRNPFEDDCSRVIFSSAFRRLQNKTQVFPLEQDDIVRTRLTHSLEVANVAKSLGLSIERHLYENEKLENEHLNEIPSILEVAGLIHDLGNPPFGHYGEGIIKSFYNEHLNDNNKKKYNLSLSDAQKKDLIYFDGNPQAFRFLTKLKFLKDEYSYNLSFPVLASIIKYPWHSDKFDDKEKFGYFTSEKDKFSEIWNNLEIEEGTRHPLSYLLEAADDIAYTANDIEDGAKKGIINSDYILDKIKEYINKEGIDKNDKIYNLISKFEKIKGLNTGITDKKVKEDSIIKQFRIAAHGMMIEETVRKFKENTTYNDIMDGKFKGELLKNSEVKNIHEFFNDFAGKEVFSHDSVIKLEIMGEEVIKGILTKFMDILETKDIDSLKNTKKKEGKLYNMLSNDFRHIFEKYSNKDEYNKLLLINDFVSGMSDSYALNLYRLIKGISF